MNVMILLPWEVSILVSPTNQKLIMSPGIFIADPNDGLAPLHSPLPSILVRSNQ